MYHGEVNVAQDELNSFLAVAEDLRVKGLTQNQPTGHSSSSSGAAAVNSNAGKVSAARPRSPLTGPQKVSRPPDPSTGGQPPPKRTRPSAPAAYSSGRTDGGGGGDSGGDDADDDIQEVVPVKSEPRDAAAVTAAAVAGPVSAGSATDNSYSNALVSEEGEAYDENYEDYGQYDQSFGGGEGGSDSALVDLGPDGSKGKDSAIFHHLLTGTKSVNFIKISVETLKSPKILQYLIGRSCSIFVHRIFSLALTSC
jgi:hypothetical protein